VSKQDAEAVARRIGAVGSLECSALTRANVPDIFAAAIRAALKAQAEKVKAKVPQKPPSACCTIL